MELIVGIMLFAVVATAVSTILAPLMKVYTKANELAECNTLLDNVANQIISDLSGATDKIRDEDLNREVSGENPNSVLRITTDAPDDVRYTIDGSDGVLLKNGVSVLSKPFYKGKSVGIICNKAPVKTGEAYILTVILLSDKDGEMLRRDYAVRPLALPSNQY